MVIVELNGCIHVRKTGENGQFVRRNRKNVAQALSGTNYPTSIKGRELTLAQMLVPLRFDAAGRLV